MNKSLNSPGYDMMGELNIEEIARISTVGGSYAGFIASDNIEIATYLSREYINSIGDFKVGSPFKIRFTVMMFCIEGEMEVQLNLVTHTLHSGEMLVVHEGTVVMGVRMDPHIRMFIMGFTRGFILSVPPSKLINNIFGRFLEMPVLKLDESVMADILSVYRLMSRRISRPEYKLKGELIWSGLQAIGCMVAEYMPELSVLETGLSRKQIIAKDFIRLVGMYGASQRDIPFYARKLCISPKYLGQAVSEVSGESPRKWICRQVILEAKALLDDPSLTVQQVSEALNFANQSFFGTFFRQHTGMSPKDYRSRELS